MEKLFNIYSEGRLIIKADETLSNLKKDLKKDKEFLEKINDLKVSDYLTFKDPNSERYWEYERIR